MQFVFVSFYSDNTSQSNDTNKKWERLLIKLPNNVNDSSRVVVVAATPSSSSSIANFDLKKYTATTPINIVEPLPPIKSPPKSKPFTATTSKQILQNFSVRTITQVSPTGNEALKRQMRFLFDRPCFNYLNGHDCGVICKWNHDLPSEREIFEKMILFNKDTIMYMYSNFIVKNQTAFIKYFPIICDIFGSKKMESSLVNAIGDCELHNKLLFYKCIYNGLVKTELSKRDALTKIANYCATNKKCYTVIVEIIIETDPLYFVDMLNKYYRLATVSHPHMLKLLQHVMDNPAPSLLTVFIDMLDIYSSTDICDIGTLKLLLSKCKQLVLGDIMLSKRLNDIVLRHN